jgi:hypothetical protein
MCNRSVIWTGPFAAGVVWTFDNNVTQGSIGMTIAVFEQWMLFVGKKRNSTYWAIGGPSEEAFATKDMITTCDDGIPCQLRAYRALIVGKDGNMLWIDLVSQI